jgi:hypothetical protein
MFLRYRVSLPKVHYFVVLAAGVPHPSGVNVIETPCKDTKRGISGLLCRDVHAYRYFNHDRSLGSYLYRIMDDSWLNVTNLLKVIDQLNQVYDPMQEFVFRGFANNGISRGYGYIGGGSGWLLSRPLVALHQQQRFSFEHWFGKSKFRQDDTTETLIVYMVFPTYHTWSDPRWSESCFGCKGSDWSRGNFTGTEKCRQNVPSYSFNAVVAFHPWHLVESEITATLLGSLPNNLYYMRQPGSNNAIPCMRDPADNRSFEPTVESIRQYAVHKTLASV